MEVKKCKKAADNSRSQWSAKEQVSNFLLSGFFKVSVIAISRKREL